MVNANNQTEPDWLIDIIPQDKGVGVFAIADVERSESGAAKVIQVPGITYPECIKRGQFTMSFNWIPDALADQLQQHKCADEFGIDTQTVPGECLIVMGRCLKAS